MAYTGLTFDPPYISSYGDECCDGRISLLHFCVVFLLAGITILIVGAVQYKEEAELFKFRKVIMITGFSVLGTGELRSYIDIHIKARLSASYKFLLSGFLLFFIKCVCFCRPRVPGNSACPEEATKMQTSRKSSLVRLGC